MGKTVLRMAVKEITLQVRNDNDQVLSGKLDRSSDCQVGPVNNNVTLVFLCSQCIFICSLALPYFLKEGGGGALRRMGTAPSLKSDRGECSSFWAAKFVVKYCLVCLNLS